MKPIYINIIWICIWLLLGGVGARLLGASHRSDIVIVYPDEIAIKKTIATISEQDTLSLGQDSISISSGAFVASKNGTKYYPEGCGGVNRIKEENRIYFSSEQEALESGREKSSLCK